jgi:hypothetical protein
MAAATRMKVHAGRPEEKLGKPWGLTSNMHNLTKPNIRRTPEKCRDLNPNQLEDRYLAIR